MSLFILISFSLKSEVCFGIVHNTDSTVFKYHQSEKILRDFKAHPHQLSKPDRKILRKELKFQTRKIPKGEGGNVGVQIFLLVLLTLAILFGSFMFIGLLAYGGGTPTFILVLLGLIAIVGIILIWVSGSRRIKRRKKLNAEQGQNQANPAPVQQY